MLNKSDPVSFVATRDLVISRVFYESTLGLTVVSDNQFSLVFQLNGHMLRIAKVDDFEPAKHTVLGWNVSDIAETAKKLRVRGVVFDRYEGMSQDELGLWFSPSGATVAWFKDPDENVLSLTQLSGGPLGPANSTR